ncbi:CpsD/CapB family tyrosine-protein kinase [Lignipirellula cremea]|uniref:Tyrosine-protein kinase YwqD n=1 Tax=Lignipirellula cremea TaxID=2528010 RepID=A0A518DML6_9BACT|nr:CpsD/CapB family tyrosine-protein kinase [Lignipirellula cremea]QDU93061.1 Tyrosine-protein kinase YwqD [Lignipirellula cremea]
MIHRTTTSASEAASAVARNDELPAYYATLLRRLSSACGESSSALRTLGVTSATSGEGVSTIAANLAMSAAERRRVVLVDANTMNPSQAHLFGVARSPGLQEAFHSSLATHDCVQETPLKNLWVLPAGRAQRFNPHLDRQEVERLVESLQERFDLVIFDLPPAEEFSSCLMLAPALQGVLFVVEAARARTDVVVQAKRRLDESQTTVLGAVLNKNDA